MKIQPLGDENSQVLTVPCSPISPEFLALAPDVGLPFPAMRNLQIAADSAETAAALDYFYNGAP
jgi:hypothetical protein